MEVNQPHILSIPTIYAPEPYTAPIYEPYKVISPIPTNTLNINTAGCTYWHRDIENTGNTQLLLDDPNGVYTTCDSVFPSFNPIDYTPKNLVITEQAPIPPLDQPEIPKPTTPNTNIPKDKKEEVYIPPCPSNSDQRVGDFRNEKKIERVKGHELVDNVCITLYEDVPFVDQYIPSAPQFAGVFSLALVGSSAPLVLNAVKPLVKKVISALQKKKKKVK